MNCLLMDMVRALLKNASMKCRYWEDALKYVAALQNCAISRADKNIKPYESLFESIPANDRMQIIWSGVYIKLTMMNAARFWLIQLSCVFDRAPWKDWLERTYGMPNGICVSNRLYLTIRNLQQVIASIQRIWNGACHWKATFWSGPSFL